MSNETLDQWISRYARRLRMGEFLRQGADVGAVFLFTFGAAVLAVKLLLPQLWPNVLWLAAGALPAAGVAWWLARRNPWSRQTSIARLDVALNSGGLLMTLAELPDQAWQAHLPQFDEWKQAMPRLRPRRFVSHLALPVLFAVGACFIPLRELQAESIPLNTSTQQATQGLQNLLQAVIEKQILPEEEKQQLEEEIQKLMEEGGNIPLTHEKWETVDALREKMRFKVESASLQQAKAQSLAERLAQVEKGELKLPPEQAEQLEQELTETLKNLKTSGALTQAPPQVQEMLERLRKNKGLPKDAKERQQALDDLKKFLEKEQSELKKLCEKCAKCQGKKAGSGEGEGEGESGGEVDPSPGSTDKKDGRPGQGGVTRGPGSADLTYGDEAEAQAAKFKEVVLPRGVLEQPKDQVLGADRTAPQVEPSGPGARSAVRDAGPAAGSSTVNRNLKPRHRNVVQKYFGK